jgi:hypothetical protein
MASEQVRDIKIMLSSKELQALKNALSVAGEAYKESAKACGEVPRTADQFLKQVEESEALYDRLEAI